MSNSIPQLKQLTQDIFDGLPHWVETAVITSKGEALGVRDNPKAYSGDWIWSDVDCSMPYAIVIGKNYDTTNWQNSMLKRICSAMTYADIAKKYDDMQKQYSDSLVSYDIDILSIENLRTKHRLLLISNKDLEITYNSDKLLLASKLLDAETEIKILKTKVNELESQLRNTTHAYNELEKERDKLYKYAAEINTTDLDRGYWAWQETDNNLDSLTCPILIPAETLRSLFLKITKLNTLNEWQPIASAPKDGNAVRLLINGGDFPLIDSDLWETIGNFGVGENQDTWTFAGWNWPHDEYCAGNGEVVGWLPLSTIFEINNLKIIE